MSVPWPCGEGRPGSAERLDRLPPTRWLTGVMFMVFLSWFVESYDIGLTGSVLPSLTKIYHLSSAGKSLFSIAANIGIVIGIVPAGWLADHYGRKRVLVIGTFAYAVLTVATGLMPTFTGIVTLRIVTGLAMGAVFPLPYVYASELAPPSLRGRLTGFADAFLSVGYFLSPVLAAVLIPTATNTTGWREMFFIGGIPVLFSLVAWRFLPESPRWYETQGRLAEANVALSQIEATVEDDLGHELPAPDCHEGPIERVHFSPWAVFSRRYIRRSLTLWTTFGSLFFIFYVIQTFMPTIINDLGFNLTSSFVFTSIIVGVSIPGKLLEAWMVERWGRKPVLLIFPSVAAAAAFLFGFSRGGVLIVALGCVMSLFGIGVDPAVKVYTSESYPTAMRAGATSFTEGFGRLLSGVIGPSFVPALLAAGGVSAVFCTVGGVALFGVIIVFLFGTETGGRSLEQIEFPDDKGSTATIAPSEGRLPSPRS